MSMCGNRSPITGECIIGCRGFGDCRRGEECAPYNASFVEKRVAFPGPGNRATPIHAVDEPCDGYRESRAKPCR